MNNKTRCPEMVSFHSFKAVTQAYNSTRPMTCSRPSTFQSLTISRGTSTPKHWASPAGEMRTAPTVARDWLSSSYSSAPSVKRSHGFSAGLATSLLGFPEVILDLRILRALTWLSFKSTMEPSVDPIWRKSAIARRPARPAICISANWSLPKWDWRSLGRSRPSEIIFSSAALISSTLSRLLHMAMHPVLLSVRSSSTPSISLLGPGSLSFSEEYSNPNNPSIAFAAPSEDLSKPSGQSTG